MGRTPIREAIKRLALENLVAVFPRRGTFAAEINIKDLAHIADVREVLEAHAAGLAAERLTDAGRVELDAADRRSPQQPGQRGHAGLMALDTRVHRFIYRACDNPFLEETLYRYFNLSLRIWYLVIDRLPHLFQRVYEHEALLQAIAEATPSALARSSPATSPPSRTRSGAFCEPRARGALRPRDRRRRRRRLRAGRAALRGPLDTRARARGRSPRLPLGRVHPHAGGALVPDRQPLLRLEVRVRARALHERAQDLPRARQGARRLELDQRHDLPARQPARLRALGRRRRARAVGLRPLPAVLQADGDLSRRSRSMAWRRGAAQARARSRQKPALPRLLRRRPAGRLRAHGRRQRLPPGGVRGLRPHDLPRPAPQRRARVSAPGDVAPATSRFAAARSSHACCSTAPARPVSSSSSAAAHAARSPPTR